MAKRNKIATMAVRELDARLRKKKLIAPKSNLIRTIAAERGIPVVDIPLAEVPMVERTNLMSGLPYLERADTPLCCSPASETYWSM